VKWGLDVQEDALRAGAGPSDPGFGEEPEDAWGTLGSDDDRRPVETERGRYVEFYERMESAVRAAAAPDATAGAAPAEAAAGDAPPESPAGSAPPVPLGAGIATLEVIEAARRSAAERSVIGL
jgi:hypothetical protein